jgi:hypothetical protein
MQRSESYPSKSRAKVLLGKLAKKLIEVHQALHIYGWRGIARHAWKRLKLK